jgi:hypothetical protein
LLALIPWTRHIAIALRRAHSPALQAHPADCKPEWIYARAPCSVGVINKQTLAPLRPTGCNYHRAERLTGPHVHARIRRRLHH